MKFTLEPHAGLPANSPARRSRVDISWKHRLNPHPLYVIPVQGFVVLTTPEVALAALCPADVTRLSAVLPGRTSQPPTRQRTRQRPGPDTHRE